MHPSGGEYLLRLRAVAEADLDNGDYVTFGWFEHNSSIYEHLLTFSGIEIKRRMSNDADDATREESSKDIRQSNEANSRPRQADDGPLAQG